MIFSAAPFLLSVVSVAFAERGELRGMGNGQHLYFSLCCTCLSNSYWGGWMWGGSGNWKELTYY